MDIESIQKSRLYRESYLPGGVVRLRNQSHGKIIGTRNNDVALEDIDKPQLIDAAGKLLSDWEAAGGIVEAGLREAIRAKRVVIQSPSEVYASPFPLLLTCSICSVIDFYDNRIKDDQQIELIARRIKSYGGRSYVSCKRSGCKGHMHQIPYVAVHRCGNLSPINIHFTARRRTNIGFKNEGGSFFSNSFFDVDTKETLAKALQDDCPGCKSAYAGMNDLNKRGTPVTSGESYYSQVIQYIALSKRVGALVSQVYAHVMADAGEMKGLTSDLAEGVASALLGCTGSQLFETQLRALLESEAPSEDAANKIKDELTKKLALAAKYEDLAALLVDTKRRIAELEQQVAQASGQFKNVRHLVPDDSTLRAIVSQRRSLEAVLLRHDVKLMPIDDAIAHGADAVAKEARAVQWHLLQDRYGVTGISHIPDLQVVLSAVGFTRERRLPTMDVNVPPVQLSAFEDLNDESLRGKSSLYAMSARTEALWIKLDPCKILQWCVTTAHWDNPGPSVLGNSQAAHAYLLAHSPALTMHPGDVAKEEKLQPTQINAPFHLLHSICHALLATARRHTGYDDKSLTEYLLPMDLSFVIYVTSVQNYTAGGLLTLFQHYLLNWFDDASLFAFNCAFDPICSDNGGACNGCVQTSIGCETFNHGLSRAYLHGGNVARDGALISGGFWNHVGS